MLIITIDTLEIGTFSGANEYLYQSGANKTLQRVLMKANSNRNVELMLYFEKRLRKMVLLSFVTANRLNVIIKLHEIFEITYEL